MTIRHFGPTPPSLLDFLKKVLREYADGQIMKEIVQNAEDAGAKTVRFLYDCREHGTSRLIWPSLAPYQGRALYAYNDALFKEEDWAGIQKPARSNKEDNPLKVGRFGIGFSSVYHLTDLPSILSGDTLAFIDPHERHFGRGETGTKLNVIQHAHILNSPEYVDQFTPYNNLFPETTYAISDGQSFDGTVFRFPIRQEGSELCENVYDNAASVRLLESFVDDADVVLLFLRSLETIDISRRIDQAQTQIRSRVEICPKSLALMKSERESFSHALEENSKIRIGQRTRACLTHQLTLTMQIAESKRRMDWIVSQVVGGSEMTDDVVSIIDKSGYIPWVGVAMPYNIPRKRRDDFSGRVFCFLPLPPGDESLTGLPVHIHGFFGVNSDRRSIKWPGADRVQGDIDAKWNFLLVTQLLPDAYMNMLTFAIEERRLPPDEIYRAWPDPGQVRPQWKLLLKQLYQLLSKHTVIYTKKGNEMGSWVKIQDAVFNFLTDVDENTERILLTVLKAANVPVAEIPQHIKKIIQSKDYINFNAKVISPEVIIDCIHKSQHGVLETLSSDDKLVLLEYIMARTKTPRLIGLRLLPLANGDFVPFSTRSASTRTVFIPTRELEQSMCYNMGNSLIQPNLNVAERQSGEVVLAFLKKNSTCISQSYGSDKFDRPEEVLLTKIGLVVCSCPTFIDTALLKSESYLRIPSRKGVIGALRAVPNPKSLQDTIKRLSKNDRQLLVRFFTSCSLTDAERDFLRQIPLFDTIPRTPSGQGRVVSASDVSFACCRTSTDQLPIHHLPEYDMICCNDDSILKLFSDLGVIQKQRKELLEDIVNAFCSDVSDKTILEDVGMWILRDLKSIKQDIGNHQFKLKSQGFILTGEGELKSPDSLFDPEDQYMSALFSKGSFPSARYANEGLLGSLRELGFRHRSNVTATELARSVVEIASENNVKKAHDLMSFLGEYPNKLKESLAGENNQTLQQFLADKRCIPCLIKSPAFYPQGIPWYRSERKMISPTETVLHTKVNILASGATMPFPKKTIPHTLLRSLGVKEHPIIENILEQMAVVSKYHGILGTSDSSRKLEKMVHGLYSLLSNAQKEEEVIQKLKSRLPACIWTETGFVDIHWAILSSRENAFHPYVSCIPQEFSTKYERLFLALGVEKCISEMQIHEIIIQIQKSEPKLGSVEKRMTFCKENKRVVQKALILLAEICKGDLSQNILVPTNEENFLELVDPKCCVFEDVEGHGDSDEVQEKLNEDNTFIVDGTLPIGIVRALGILPLGRKILAAEDLTWIEQAGQYEPLTTRIKNIIKDSYLESSIPKEMIQNAEDAGATKVHFMLDLRENSGARSSLFDKGMGDCQGPAMWVFNDASFTPDDFQNITKLGGATKGLDTSKIGRFGIGFNSVYHLTDVPSFLSREYLQVFDPHATHLGSMLKSKDSPGIRINLQGKNNAISMYKDQFAPYEGVFNCSLQESKGNVDYDGTLFRLPLRSRHAALRGEISDEHYDEDKCKSLLIDLWRSSEDLLVFTKNIHEVKAFVLLPNANHPSESSQLFAIEKESADNRDIMAEFKQSTGDVKKKNKITPLIKQECVVPSITPYGNKYLQIQEEPRKHKLMSVTSVGKTSTHKMWQTPQGQKSGLAPVGGVAVKLPFSGRVDGKLYNGLPLSVPQSHLPCHCNGFFATSADRRNLWKPSSDSDSNYFTRWNDAVFEDIISKAYVTLLANKEFQCQVGQMPNKVRISGVNTSPDNFYRLWPNGSKITQGSDGYAMLKGFYNILVASDSRDPKIFWEGDRTWSFKETVFIDPVLQESPHVASAVKKVLQRQHKKLIVTEMPKKIRSTLERMGLGEQLKRRTCLQHPFFKKYFLPHISVIPSEVRDHLIHYCLSNVELRETLRTIACIPTSPDGKNLKRPSELVHPTGKASILFAEEDRRFPYGSFADWDCLHFLVELGMDQDDISGTDFIKCVQKLPSKPFDHELVDYLTYRLKKENSSWAKDQSLQNQLKNIAFIPVTYRNSSVRKASRDTIYVSEKLSLVSEVAPVLDESKMWIPYQVKTFLGIVQDPEVDVVLQQLQSISSRPENVASLPSVCQEIYRFLDLRVKKGNGIAQIQEFFHSPSTKKCLLVDKMFRSADHLALEFEEECVGSHLCRVPSNLRGFEALLSTLHMKRRFSTHDFLSTLKCIHGSTSGTLNESEFGEVMKLLKCLINAASANPLAMHDVPPNDIYVPDSNSYLRTANELSFCDVDWISVPDDVITAHGDIPLTWAKILGVRDIRQHILESYSVSVPGLNTLDSQNLLQFGQREPLTERIKNILEGYPCDDTILKELVQNADDSCATEVHLVLDVRTHPKDRLFRDEMSHLQGPALCIYNNKAFSDADIEGIQRLGVGSKRNLSSKVGRFGVGFNAAYHLTDCPSFYTNGDTLGMFDPNVKYVPNATLAYPGFMAKPTGKLKDDFPNVFNCYLPEFFEGQGSTMFRLPLRTESMAKVSSISSEAHDVDSVKGLMQKFKKGLPDLLLFLNHVKKVSISIIDEMGNMKDTSSVQASISESKQLDLEAFLATISAEETDPVTGISKSLEDIPVAEVHYDMRVTVTEQRAKSVKTQSDDWLIYQQHGFAKPKEVPDTVLDAYNRGDLPVLPQGGVALPLGKRPVSSKAYSFLPLPIDTGLPVHVNGSFELDEQRRDIWRDKEDVQAQWNRQIMKQIVSPAYVKALCCFQAEKMTHIEESKDESEMQDIVSSYTSFLPVTAENSFWKELIEDIYRTIADSAQPMFPSIRRSVSYNRDGDSTDGVNNIRTLEWRTPLAESQVQGFFDSPIGTDRNLRSVVSDLGFPLIECSQNVQTIFSDSLHDSRKGDILEITPASLISHLSSQAVEDVGLAQMKLPKQISDTVIHDKATLGVILNYCSQCDNFKDNVEGLPLLATSDGILRTFSTETPVYITEFDDLFPSSRSKFLDRSIRKYFNEDFDVICHFDIPCVASLMREELCPIKFECDQYVQWDKTEPTEKWITRLWECLATCRNPDDELTCLSKWSILPCRKNGEMGITHHLVPLSKATSVMCKLSDMSHILAALSSLRVSEVDQSLDFEEAEQLITKIVAHEDRPDAVLAVFDHVIQTNASLFDRLTPAQRDHILQYLTTHMPERLVENVDNRRIIMNLPCFEQLDGTYVSLSNTSTIYVVRADLPREEMTKWMAEYNEVFLCEDVGLKELFEAIGCDFISEYDTLSKFIFPNFHLLSSEIRLKHLENLYQHRYRIGRIDKCMKLRDYPLLEDNDGELKVGREFFDRGNKVFAKMLTEGKFPSEKIIERLQPSFLHEFGVQAEVTAEMFLGFAKELSTNLRNERKKRKKRKMLAEQSETLVEELFRNCNLLKNDSFLNSVKFIDFMIPDTPKMSLKKLHPYHMDVNMGVRFNSSSLHVNAHIVWCSMRLLPEYLSSMSLTCHHEKDSILEKLGVVRKPIIESVIENTSKMCCRVHDQGNQTDFQVLAKVMDKTYRFLNSACERNTDQRCSDRTNRCRSCQLMSEKLSDVPCVVIQSVPSLVRPTLIYGQFCGDLFQPHLYQLPDSLIHYSKLLYSLGSTRTPSFPQLTTVLNGLASHSMKEMKNPNMLKAIIAASKLFFQQIESLTSGTKLTTAILQADLEGIQIVHLPASSKGKMLPSTEIFIKDETVRTKRLVESNVPFLPDEVTKLLTNVHTMVDSMPTHLKPRSVKACVTEKVDISARCLYQKVGQCKFDTRLNGLMTSNEFDEAIQRLLEVGSDTDVNADHPRIDKLKKLRLQCMAELSTSLFIDGRRIEGSEAKLRYHMSYNDVDAEKACIRVVHTEDNERSAYMKVVKGIAQAILRHVGGIGQKHLPFLVDMLSADLPREIPKLLRSYKLIRRDGRANEHDEGLAPPKLGSRIPSDILHLLEQDPYLGFFKGEYVAYQINTDIDIHVIPIHVYSQVLDVPENLLSPLRNKYLIDIGEEDPVWVSGLDLFKFLMLEESVDTGMTIMVYCHSSDGQGPEGPATPETPPTTEVPPRTEVPPKPQPYPKNIEEAKQQVTDQLEEIWELDKDERKKAVKRIWLGLHPDNHPPERKHLATKVLNHLQNEIERLKAGRRRTGQAWESRGSSGDFFDDAFYEFMRNWARQVGRRRETYHRSYRDRGYFGNARSRPCPPSFDDTPEPDMPRASTWFKQATSDLAASSNDLGKEANEWVCFKSYHAAEKALKAAQFASRGTSNPSHNLDVLVTDLEGHFRNQTVTDRARQLNILVDVNDCMYPGASIFPHRVPCERFSQSDAESARQCASDIVEEIRKHLKF
ncbi:sacsin-like [Strongylocentrotus purpuratus]|uniref:HEPN domain-containing protein n=1 Tax=Strongylocentrotus purpuratus TaxID=7668 RepID=A0A7M7PF81_STRPU|nr:sacsin-like [Strongylocentrotus purpuratus]